MRVGFVTRLLWDRYGTFWSGLIGAAPADVIMPEPEGVRRALTDPRLARIPGSAFREAAAQAIALSTCDRIVAPDLNFGYQGARGSAQDPFVADFPAALARTVPGLPPILAVPADLAAPGLETKAIEILLAVAPGPSGVRRVWQTRRAEARPPRPPAPPAQRPATATLVGLVGQPWHLRDEVVERLTRPGEELIPAHGFDPRDLREEGLRLDDGLAPTDAEALGAVRRLARRTGVARLRMIVDPESGADDWLERKARTLVRRPLETVPPPAAAAADEHDASDGDAAG